VSAVIPLHRCAPLGPGDRVGSFILEDRLGAGGMGEVFLATHESLGRAVAIKVLNAEHRHNARMHERFAREARIAGRVVHENVVAVTELHALDDGRPYMVMEYVDGEDLSAYAEHGLTLVQFISLATQIADALGAAHRAGVVHRDLKPANILVTDDARIKLLDFGVARMAHGEDDRLTQTGQIMATPGYMSPEQSTGEPVDARSDLYSLGVILWELAVGARPFEGRSFGEWVLLHSTREPLAPSQAERTQLRGDIPEALDSAILRCLAKRPEDRFATAAELRDALAGEQALLAAILDGANDGIVAVDDSRRVVRVNRAAWALLGGEASTGAVTGTPIACSALLGCDGRAAGATERGTLRCGPRCRFEEVLEGPSAIVDAELRLARDDGTEIPVAASFSAMAGPQPGAVVVLRDLRAELAAEELRASFVAAVSHELRTPLALIGGYVDSLLGLELDAVAQRRSVERIGGAARRLNVLVDELLDLTQLEHASLGLRRTRVDVAALLAQVVRDLGESPGMPLVHVAAPADLPPVDADSVRVGHVVANLVDNARKYGGDGPVTITARRSRRTVVITVSDTGRGIPVDERGLVFDRFYRGRAALGGTTRGTGLGLYVCRRLVEAHGGEIWVDADVPTSAISFSLPAARAGAARTSR